MIACSLVHSTLKTSLKGSTIYRLENLAGIFCSVIDNSAAEYRPLLIFGIFVYYGSVEAAKWLTSLPVKVNMDGRCQNCAQIGILT